MLLSTANPSLIGLLGLFLSASGRRNAARGDHVLV
ncbi:hypothetical protein AALP_AA3G079800 [Arabis alpina]|uniref:Uncharacterized protein n=1 Tax=Arabis alpina TaxID=50452 RepID=A0A087H7T0_ARAAL|nr:hypothetical protein AALP_AA3G079800 [Arabis alpina]